MAADLQRELSEAGSTLEDQKGLLQKVWMTLRRYMMSVTLLGRN